MGWSQFFGKALHREPDQRFDNADEMRWAWQKVFKEAEQRKITTPTGEEVELSVSLEQARLDTLISALGLSTRARNALERANVITVRDFLNFPISDIHMMRGVGNQTRQEILRFLGELRGRFPNVEPVRPKETAHEETAGPPSLESLYHGIVGVRNPKKETDWNIRCSLLGVTAPESQPASLWPSQTDVAEALITLAPQGLSGLAGGSYTVEQRPARYRLSPRGLRTNPAARRCRHDPRNDRPNDPAASPRRHARIRPAAANGFSHRQGGGRNRRHDGPAAIPASSGRG